jgi:hypothetical protein
MGETQDWQITAPFLDRRSRRGRLGREMLAISWLTTLREEEGEGQRGAGCFMRSPVSISGALGACIDGMAVVSGKWDTGQD